MASNSLCELLNVCEVLHSKPADNVNTRRTNHCQKWCWKQELSPRSTGTASSDVVNLFLQREMWKCHLILRCFRYLEALRHGMTADLTNAFLPVYFSFSSYCFSCLLIDLLSESVKNHRLMPPLSTAPEAVCFRFTVCPAVRAWLRAC